MDENKGTRKMDVSENDIRDLRADIGEVHRKLDVRDARQMTRFERYVDENHRAHNCLQKQLGDMATAIATLAGRDDVVDIDKKVDRNSTKVNLMFTGFGLIITGLVAKVLGA